MEEPELIGKTVDHILDWVQPPEVREFKQLLEEQHADMLELIYVAYAHNLRYYRLLGRTEQDPIFDALRTVRDRKVQRERDRLREGMQKLLEWWKTKERRAG